MNILGKKEVQESEAGRKKIFRENIFYGCPLGVMISMHDSDQTGLGEKKCWKNMAYAQADF